MRPSTGQSTNAKSNRSHLNMRYLPSRHDPVQLAAAWARRARLDAVAAVEVADVRLRVVVRAKAGGAEPQPRWEPEVAQIQVSES